MREFMAITKALSDPNRVRILLALRQGELCVCQLTAVLDLAPGTVSKHLAALKTAGLVQLRRDGRWAYYRIAERQLNPYAPKFLELVGRAMADDPTLAEDRRVLAAVNAVPLQVLCDLGRAALPANVPAPDTTTCCGGAK